MDVSAHNKKIWLCTALMLLATVCVYVAEQRGALSGVRMTLHNALSPGRLVLAAMASGRRSPELSAELSVDDLLPEEVSALQNRLLENELQRRQLVIDNARLRNELRVARLQSSAQVTAGRSLMNFQARRASVLNQTSVPRQLDELFISAGARLGLKRSQLVVEGSGILLDQGQDVGIQADQAVMSGLAVVGRISRVSSWVSLVQPVTDQEFSAAVQLVQGGSGGAAFGAKGLLQGTGAELCRITGVPYTAAVSVGDEVYSADIDGIHGPRLYYGTVVTAEFSAGGVWDIQVQPAFDRSHLHEVAVVQPQLNAARIPSRSPGSTAGAGPAARPAAGAGL
ncbi:MAG: rod shape-determining protein MreC [Fuerstiella sp.]